MKKIKALVILALSLMSATTVNASTWDWSTLFGGNSSSSTSGKTTSTIGNLLEGIFSRSDITVADMAGTWTVTGSAVAFKSEDFLSQAGGTAAAAAIQTELDPYYKQYGLTGAVVTVDADGKCNITHAKGSINGTISQDKDGDFVFKITILGQSLGSIPVYVRKTSVTMDMMFDVAKLKQVLQVVAKLSGNTLAQSVVSILDKYEGVYVGFGMSANSSSESETNPVSTGLDALRGILNGKK